MSVTHVEHRRNGFVVSSDPSRLDVAAVHEYLARSYWARGIPRELVARSIEHSLCLGLFDGAHQVGFARAVTDRATFAYLADVYVLEEYRGRGLGKWLVACVMTHPDLQGLRRWVLVTRDAHDLYRQLGWSALGDASSYMEIRVPNGYAPTSDA